MTSTRPLGRPDEQSANSPTEKKTIATRWKAEQTLVQGISAKKAPGSAILRSRTKKRNGRGRKEMAFLHPKGRRRRKPAANLQSQGVSV